MFSLNAARILDNDADENNFKSVFNQLTGLTIGESFEEPDVDYVPEPANPKMVMAMGAGSKEERENSSLI